MIAITEKNDFLIVPVKIITKASKNAIGNEYNNALKLYITTPPIDGKANKAIIKFLSKILHLPQKNIEIISGHTNSNKKIKIKIAKKEFLKAVGLN